MAEGRVVAFDRHRGNGVIEGALGERLFFETSAVIAPGQSRLTVGQNVSYDVSVGASGRRAVNVVPR